MTRTPYFDKFSLPKEDADVLKPFITEKLKEFARIMVELSNSKEGTFRLTEKYFNKFKIYKEKQDTWLQEVYGLDWVTLKNNQ